MVNSPKSCVFFRSAEVHAADRARHEAMAPTAVENTVAPVGWELRQGYPYTPLKGGQERPPGVHPKVEWQLERSNVSSGLSHGSMWILVQ